MTRIILLSSLVRPSKDSPTVVIGYTNWRGEYGEREIVPMHPWFGATDWHPELQWLLKAWDVAKDAERDFAIKDIGFKEALALRTPSDGWRPIETAPVACTLLATYFDEEVGEWIVQIFVADKPTAPFTHWQFITSPGKE